MTESLVPATPVLDAIIETMKTVVAEDKELDMRAYYQNLYLIKGVTTVHNCGTAACVCGYAALDPNVIELVNLNEFQGEPYSVWLAITKEFASWSVSNSMFYACYEDRRFSAKRVEWLRHLLDHPHLNRETPTAAEALDYLEKVKIAFNEVKHA